MANSVRHRFIDKIRPYKPIEPVPKLASVYTTFNEIWLYVRYASLGQNKRYWFDIDTYKVNEWRDARRFVVCLICGDENNVVFLPDEQLLSWYDGVESNRKGHWMVTLAVEGARLVLKMPGTRPDYDVSEFVNRYDFISKAIPVQRMERTASAASAAATAEEVNRLIMADPDLRGPSLHERVVDLLAHVGQWSGYIARKSLKVPEDSPYQIDVAWLRNDALDVAIEVQVGGNETEAKDRLIHARRFGARKIVVVSTPESMPRLRSICRYEPELKNWLQLWSIARVYQMYTAGQEFFALFRPFERQQWSEEITDFL